MPVILQSYGWTQEHPQCSPLNYGLAFTHIYRLGPEPRDGCAMPSLKKDRGHETPVWAGATLLHELGTPLKVAHAQLGHSHLSTTLEVYTHASASAQRQAVDQLENQLFPNVPKFSTEEEIPGGLIQ